MIFDANEVNQGKLKHLVWDSYICGAPVSEFLSYNDYNDQREVVEKEYKISLEKAPLPGTRICLDKKPLPSNDSVAAQERSEIVEDATSMSISTSDVDEDEEKIASDEATLPPDTFTYNLNKLNSCNGFIPGK